MNYSMERECDSCRQAPAAVYCRADAAALCAACDAEIHAANPISRRHHRVPVGSSRADEEEGGGGRSKYCEALFGGGEVDEYLDLAEFGPCADHGDHHNVDGTEQVKEEAVGEERVVPVRGSVLPTKKAYHETEYEASNAGFCYSVPHSVSLSSMEASHVVPDSADNPNSFAMELFSSPLLHMPSQPSSPMDREARVLRYREKRKNRKFEKTIRYASRKAYAEARPRIKGRFAKRTDVELEVDRMFANYADVPEGGYGVVPWF
ncbi:zinc finger protein CONSTANS-LIKE 2 isoform X1 [Iris pallida]|uniref:Zinc finger protein CONSTANS-LIKE 2 isoform X1 n=1 Tax=Iris pallida TaxID=29817 RepID=A0AAX6ESX1_IRIPA|nr:zinc finger protein CONSTANS-LIKE 2 isoform X1 [Iris pallida]